MKKLFGLLIIVAVVLGGAALWELVHDQLWRGLFLVVGMLCAVGYAGLVSKVDHE